VDASSVAAILTAIGVGGIAGSWLRGEHERTEWFRERMIEAASNFLDHAAAARSELTNASRAVVAYGRGSGEAEDALTSAEHAIAKVEADVPPLSVIFPKLRDRPDLWVAAMNFAHTLWEAFALIRDPQTPPERHIYTVTAAVTLVRPEDDGDFHLVLRDAVGRTMIAETPMGSCDRVATPKRQRQMATARAHVRLCARASVTGVAFFDFNHGQTGVAPNAIELHPVLAFRCLTAPKPITTPRTKCAPSYPDVCIPPPPPDLDCADIRYTNFRVLWNVPDPDPHHFDGNRDGIGCQS
jgi:hypothetical protein